MASKRKLALGGVLCVFAAAGILFSISEPAFFPEALAKGIDFLLGLAAGMGTILVGSNLTTKGPDKAEDSSVLGVIFKFRR